MFDLGDKVTHPDRSGEVGVVIEFRQDRPDEYSAFVVWDFTVDGQGLSEGNGDGSWYPNEDLDHFSPEVSPS